MARVYETAVRIAASFSKNFKGETLSAAAAVSRLSGETKRLKSAELATESFGRLSVAVTDAKKKYDTATAAVARLAEAERAAGGATKESAAWMKAGAAAVKSAGAALDKATKAAGANAAALHAAGVKTGDMAAAQRKLAADLAATERRLKLAELANKHFGKTLEGIGKRAKEYGTLEGAIGKTAGSAGSLASDAAKAAGVLSAVGAGLAALTHRTIEAGDEISDTAANLGITTTALQELRFAAERGGSSAEDLDKGLARFNETTGDALSGNKAAVASFAAVGISMKSLRALTPEQRFAKLADAIGKIQDPARRAAAAQNFLGKTSKSMVAFLADGSEGIAKLRAQAVGILTPEAIANASKAKDAMQLAGASIKGVGNILGAALLPTATRVFERLGTWVADNQGKIKAWAELAAKWIEGKAIPAIVALIPKIEAVARSVGKWVSGGLSLIGGVENLGTALIALRLAPTAIGLVGIAINVARLAAAFPALTASMLPFLATVGPIVAVAAGLLAVYAAASKVSDAIDEAQARNLKGEDAARFQALQEKRFASPEHAAFRRRVDAEAAAARAAGPRTQGPRTGAGGSTSVSYAPVINIQGNADQAAVEAAHAKARDDFEAKWNAMHRRQARLANG